MNTVSNKTIIALASAQGRAGVAVVRVSGSNARAAVERLCNPATLPAPRLASLRALMDPRTGEKLDQALVLFFPAPHSFTGEDVVELHLHGGRSIIKGVIEALCALDGFALAEPGAFTRRAFENGKMDLTEAEALADLVDAETVAQRRQALRQMDGELGRQMNDWAARIKRSLAYIEAEIDFADEDIPADLTKDRLLDVTALEKEMGAFLDDHHRGERVREGFVVALLGAPNAGKSSILNALAKREAAIVDPTPGTTRDMIEVHLDLGGYPVTLVDTAGLRDTADRIESEGVRRALARAEQADLKILVFDARHPPQEDPTTWALADEQTLIVLNKVDLCSAPPKEHMNPPPPGEGLGAGCIKISNPVLSSIVLLTLSAKTGEGLPALSQAITSFIAARYGAGEGAALTRLRHRQALEEARGHLTRALAASETELCAEDMRLAMRAIGRITGRVDVEDILGEIFSSFCIGK